MWSKDTITMASFQGKTDSVKMMLTTLIEDDYLLSYCFQASEKTGKRLRPFQRYQIQTENLFALVKEQSMKIRINLGNS